MGFIVVILACVLLFLVIAFWCNFDERADEINRKQMTIMSILEKTNEGIKKLDPSNKIVNQLVSNSLNEKTKTMSDSDTETSNDKRNTRKPKKVKYETTETSEEPIKKVKVQRD